MGLPLTELNNSMQTVVENSGIGCCQQLGRLELNLIQKKPPLLESGLAVYYILEGRLCFG